MYRYNSHSRIDDIRMLHSNTQNIKYDFLLCKTITTITKAVDIFDMLNSFFITYVSYIAHNYFYADIKYIYKYNL